MGATVLHISRARYQRIVRQGFVMGIGYPDRPRTVDSDVIYHMLNGDRGVCDECGTLANSLLSETPADLEREKRQLSARLEQ